MHKLKVKTDTPAEMLIEVRRKETLLKAGALQDAIFNSANFSSIATDEKGVIQIFNVGAERMLGYAAAEVLNKITPAEISDPQELVARAHALSTELGTPIKPGFEALVFKASRGIEDIYELTYIRKDESRFPAMVSVTALRDDVGGIIGYLLIGTDNSARKRAEEALLKAGALQNAIFNSANFSSIATDEKGVIQIFNVGAERMLGYTAADVLNKITPADISDPRELVARAKELSAELGTTIKPGFEALVFKASRGIEDIYELTYIRKDESRFPALVSVTALRDAADAIIGYLLIGTDNSARKQVEAERLVLDQRLRDQQFYTRSLIESTIDALMTTDPRGIITDVNKQMEALTGCTRDELIGAPFKDYFTDPERAEAGIKLVLSEGKVSNYELTARARDGKETVVSYNAATFHDRDRKLKGVFAAARDVTERKLFDRTLQEKNIELQAANVAKREFLAVMSHEIRTPMNGILGMTELTLNTELTSSQRDYLKVVKSSAESLLTLLNDLLDFSKIEAGKLELECIAFDLRDTLGDTLQTLATRAGEKGLELSLHIRPDVPDALFGDPHRLRQIVVNLVGNALKFTERGEIAVQVETAGDIDGQAIVRFAVVDTGIGIAPASHTSIFSAFEQADASTTRRYGGTGLGLAITRQIVELMGGAITVESELGRGSTFSFSARFGRQAVRHDLTQLPELRQVRVLVVDDHQTNRMILRELFTSWEMDVVEADGAHAAMIALRAAQRAGQPFALVITDLMMPETDGFGLAALMKEDAALRDTRVILLTSAGRKEDVVRCRAAGIVAQLSKPVKHSLLLDTILELGGHSRKVQLTTTQIPRQRHLRILLAEDNAVNQQVAVANLESWGHRVTVVDDGRMAVDAVTRTSFDLVLMDSQMPGMGGFEATAVIRQRELGTCAHTPIIAMTANVMKGFREECLAGGMDGYVSKPIRVPELIAAMAAAVPDLLLEPLAPVAESRATSPVKNREQPIFDVAALLEGAGGSRALAHQMIALCCEQDGPRLSRELAEALQQGDLGGVERTAHAISGLVGEFHAGSASRLAQTLEDSARQQRSDIVQAQAAELERELQRLLGALQLFAREPSDQPALT
jgi:PAS domain S-box-containing protein